jgi:hypothetical protein
MYVITSKIRVSPVHIVPACAVSWEGSDHFRSYVRNISLHFCKRLFRGLEPMTSWSQAYNIFPEGWVHYQVLAIYLR